MLPSLRPGVESQVVNNVDNFPLAKTHRDRKPDPNDAGDEAAALLAVV